MNRAQRRKYNQKHHTTYSKEDFELALALARIQQGDIDPSVLNGLSNAIHMDNELIAPTGCVVKLNYENIMRRTDEAVTDEFKAWVEENKDKEFHLTREENQQSLVCLEEDVRYGELDGKQVIKPKWLFDLYNDILIKDGDEFKTALELDVDESSDADPDKEETDVLTVNAEDVTSDNAENNNK